MKAVVHPSLIKAVSDALLKNDNLMTPIAIFVSNYVKKELNHVRKEENVFRARRKTRGLPPLPPTPDPWNDGGIPSTEKQIDAHDVIRNARRSRVCLKVPSKETLEV